MEITKYSLWATLAALLTACGGSSSNSNSKDPTDLVLEETFHDLEEYTFSDFNVGDEYRYWELRVNREALDEDEDYQSLYRFGVQRLEHLSDDVLTELDSANTNTGFERLGCPPMNCPIFGVAVTEENVEILDNESYLLSFFGTLDTEAELHTLLWTSGYQGDTFEEVGGGYRAVAHWDDQCGETGTDLLFVDTNGVITVEEELEHEDDPSAPCA